MRLPLWKRKQDAELEEEVRAHLKMAVTARMERGESRADAEAAARREFGNELLVREVTRDQWGWSWLEELGQDVRYGARVLRKNGVVTAVAIVILALGIGANTAIFSAAEGIWLRPLSSSNISQIAVLGQQSTASRWYSVAPATYREWRTRSTSFRSITAYQNRMVTLTGSAAPRRIQAAAVDSGFFEMFGAVPELGRTFAADEYAPGHQVAVLSYSLWQTQFGGKRDIVGLNIHLDGHATMIIGVMGRNAEYPAATDVWMPLALTPEQWADTGREQVRALGLIAHGTSLDNATAELSLLMRAAAQRAPKDYEELRPDVRWLRDVINGSMTPGFVRVLLGAAGFVLLIACINLGNLQLARASSRRKEFSLRAALGCSRARLARQVMTESMLLAMVGAVFGLLIAYWAVRLMVTGMPPDTARQIAGWSTMGIDARVLLFTAAAACVSGIVAGLVPVARGFRFAPGDALKAGTTSHDAAPHRLRGTLVAVEAAIALMLLVGTVLVVEGFEHLLAGAERFQPQSLLTFEVELNSPKHATPAAKANFYASAVEAIAALPGVTSAATFSSYPMSNNGVTWRVFRTASMTEKRHLPAAVFQSVSPQFLQTVGVPLLGGRNIADSDGPDSLRVALISDVMAKKYWPGKSPIGESVLLREADNEVPLTVIGITGNVEYDWTDNEPESVIYVPFRQHPDAHALLAARSTASATLAPEVRSVIANIDPDLPLSNVKTLDRLIVESLAGLMQIEGLMSTFGIIALVLAAAGIYDLVSYTVAQRTHEVGIRIAIGASAGHVLRLVLGQTLRLALIGAAVGLLGAIAMGRLVAGFFFGAKVASPVPFVAAFTVLVLTAALASLGPALRATKVDPMVALRYE